MTHCEKYDPEERAEFERLKPLVLAALKLAKAVRVEMTYDGCGDDGQIHSIVAFGQTGRRVAISKKSTVLEEYDSLNEALDHFAWTLLQMRHVGFEDGDGGCGEITIDVAKGTVVLDHNDRFTDFVNTLTEL